jgi:Rha family phage regulatory protein
MQSIVISSDCTVSSFEVADKFGKRHKDVLRAFRRITKEQANESDKQVSGIIERIFAPNYISNLHTGAKELESVSMTRDGFALLAMGFTGAEATRWKLKFVAAFNEMESHLQQATIQEPARPKLLDKPKTARITASLKKIDTLFGEPMIKRTMTRVDEGLLTPVERLEAKRFNLILQAEGALRKAKKLEGEIDFLTQPPALRLIKD